MNNRLVHLTCLLLSLYYLTLFFTASFYPQLSTLFLADNLSYGDLFQMSKIKDFKVPLPQIQPVTNLSSPQEADIIIMGDSFFNIAAGYPFFASQLQQKLNLNVHNYNIQGSGESWRQTNPLNYLESFSLKNSNQKKILILESVDRGVELRYKFINPSKLGTPSSEEKKIPTPSSSSPDLSPPIGSIDKVFQQNDTIYLEGWAADHSYGSPLKEVIISLDDFPLGSALLNIPRPDVASFYKNPSWSNAGWTFSFSVRKLKAGKHRLSATYIDHSNNKVLSSKPTNFYYHPLKSFLSKKKNFVLYANQKIQSKIKAFIYLLQENKLNSSFTETINTIKFRLFRQLSDLTPKYSLDPKLLFYKSEVDFFQNPLSAATLEQISQNLKTISDELNNRYNIDFYFLPMPTKYMIYHQLSGETKSNDFFSRLFQLLDQKQVKYINLYQPFLESKDIVYFVSDTHWNNSGIQISINQTIKRLTKTK